MDEAEASYILFSSLRTRIRHLRGLAPMGPVNSNRTNASVVHIEGYGFCGRLRMLGVSRQ